MNKSAIEKFAKYARRTLIELVTQKARYYGVTAKEIFPVDSESSDAIVIHGTVHSKKIKQQREMLVREIKAKGFEQVVDEVAYTWVNRFAALRFMEVNEYLPTGVRVFSSIEPGKTEPDLLTHALDVGLPVSKDEVYRYRDAHDDEGLYKMLLIAQCNALNTPLPFLFETISDYTELLFPDHMLAPDSLIRRLVNDIPEEDWREIEIVGWLYQFYISEKKDQVIGKVVKKEDIPSATQLFTPKWIVQYMVENSLGRLWLEMHPDSPLRGKMQYYIENPDDKDIKRDMIRPEEITCMDDACGSGHILVYMFDILYAIYEEMGYVGREIPSLILKNNLYGIDIDLRAVQLASFALMMKACEKDRRFLSRGVLPRVIEIQESNGIDLGFLLKMDRKQWDQFRIKIKQQDMFDSQDQNEIFDWASEQAGTISQHTWVQSLQQLVDLFHDAKNYGSLLTIPNNLIVKFPEIRKMLEQLGSDDLFGEITHILQIILTQADVLADRYYICVANPPYMGIKGMNPALKEFSATKYQNSKSDMFAMFIERNGVFTKTAGITGMITMESWMFLSSYQKLREEFLKSRTIQSLIHMPYDGKGRTSLGINFGTAAMIFSNFVDIDRKAQYMCLRHYEIDDSGIPLQFPIVNERLSWVSSEDFCKISGSPIAYWISENVRNVFIRNAPLKNFIDTRKGMVTGDNNYYIRYWHEVAFDRIGFGARNRNEALETGCKWFPQVKGGEFRKWYGNHDTVINWENDGQILQNRMHPSGARTLSTNLNLEYLFRSGVAWTKISSGFYAARILPYGYIFNDASACAFCDKKIEFAILSYLCSCLSNLFLPILNPTFNYLTGNIDDLPISESLLLNSDHLTELSLKCTKLAKHDWDDSESSIDFERISMLDISRIGCNIEETFDKLKAINNIKFMNLKKLESEINSIWIEECGLEKEFLSEVHEQDITLRKTSDEMEICELISYAIGCLMGRYSINTPGLVFAGGDWDNRWHQYETRRRKMEELRLRDVANGELLARDEPYEVPDGCSSWKHSPSFPEDDDGIIPLLAEDYFEDDGTCRIVEFLRVTFGEKTLSENLQFLADNLLKIKQGESPTQVIRRYLSMQFFKDHCQTYKKRPIYWLFTSGPERAFQALIYMHRYTPSMLAKMRTDYLHELQGKIEIRVKHLQEQASTGTLKEQKDAGKQLTSLHKQQAELRKYDELLRHYADQQIEIDLDDGVKVNYAKFGELLAPIPGMKQGDDE